MRATAAYNSTTMEAQSITLALTDTSQGFDASPDRVRLSALVDFAADVEVFLRGQDREVDTSATAVSVRKGSLELVTERFALPPKLVRDLHVLLNGELLDALDGKRREVIERWQKLARSLRNVSFRISAPFLPRPVLVDASTDFRADDADQWVDVERYVRGEILDLGGATRANAHVRLPDGSTLKVTTDKEVLRDDTVNRLYKPAMLRIKAKYNVLTRALRDARLVEFVQYTPRFDDGDMERLTRRGAQAWKDVENATAWVEELRGGVD